MRREPTQTWWCRVVHLEMGWDYHTCMTKKGIDYYRSFGCIITVEWENDTRTYVVTAGQYGDEMNSLITPIYENALEHIHLLGRDFNRLEIWEGEKKKYTIYADDNLLESQATFEELNKCILERIKRKDMARRFLRLL